MSRQSICPRCRTLTERDHADAERREVGTGFDHNPQRCEVQRLKRHPVITNALEAYQAVAADASKAALTAIKAREAEGWHWAEDPEVLGVWGLMHPDQTAHPRRAAVVVYADGDWEVGQYLDL